MTACAICSQPIEPDPRYFTADGKPRHMLCDEPGKDTGAAVRTKREAYALVRAMRDRWHNADRLRLYNDPRCWD